MEEKKETFVHDGIDLMDEATWDLDTVVIPERPQEMCTCGAKELENPETPECCT